MKVEIRADNTAHITGYVNVVERESKPVITPKGKVNETVEARAFERALEKAESVDMTLDHNPNRVLANTADKTLKLYEDNIGLRAEAIISDEETVNAARQGKLKGWSFGMRNVVDTVEERADKLPLRHIKSLDLDHVTLVLNKNPCYSATSVELRANVETDIETRCLETEISVTEHKKIEKVDYTDYENKLKRIKGE